MGVSVRWLFLHVLKFACAIQHGPQSVLSFLHNDCKLVHANVQPASLFCDSLGNWKLGGFELLHDISLEGSPSYTRRNTDVCPDQYMCPMMAKGDWSAILGYGWQTMRLLVALVLPFYFLGFFCHVRREENKHNTCQIRACLSISVFACHRPPAVAVDSWSLACIIHEVFNGPLVSRDKLSAVGRIPAPLVPDYKKLSTILT
jgi:hypothetical protein